MTLVIENFATTDTTEKSTILVQKVALVSGLSLILLVSAFSLFDGNLHTATADNYTATHSLPIHQTPINDKAFLFEQLGDGGDGGGDGGGDSGGDGGGGDKPLPKPKPPRPPRPPV
ncbi:MAG: hypothetical protein K2Q32_07850 [Alphaproteobacteria bacterium]|nr:hypothetical protein [Alphaproteobacteria bacterium]